MLNPNNLRVVWSIRVSEFTESDTGEFEFDPIYFLQKLHNKKLESSDGSIASSHPKTKTKVSSVLYQLNHTLSRVAAVD